MSSPRRQAARLIPRGSSLSDAVSAAESMLGMPIRIRHRDSLHGPAAVSMIAREYGMAVIQVDRAVDKERFAHVVAHELGHLVLGHIDADHPALSREHYDTRLEREAELFGTEVVRRMRQEPLSEQSLLVR